ncbi:sensor histidine kinase [Ammoniphilus sp. 3BR4]|uniref:sensor histidine kinase n=1 Tax=Ammoniphilus sp. 3BR4 TaxID=3158265 RepID=UPI0034655584
MLNRFVSLRTKLIVAFLCFILLPIVGVGIYTYSQVEDLLRDQVFQSNADRLNQVNRNIEREMNLMLNSAMSIVLDENVYKILKQPPITAGERLRYVGQMDKKYLEITTAIINSPVYLTVLDKQGNLYTNWGQNHQSHHRISRSDWYQKALLQNGYMAWTLNHDSYISPYSGKMVTLAMLIKDKNLKNDIGMLVISQPVEQFVGILRLKGEKRGNVGFIVDQDGIFLGEETKRIETVYPHIQSKLGSSRSMFAHRIDGEWVEVISNTIPLTDWKVVQIVPHQGILNPIFKIRNIAILILLTSLTIFTLLLILASSMMTRPLRNMRGLMKRVESGDLEVSFPSHERDEVGLLGKNFNHMVVKLKRHLENEIELERSKEKAKLEALQAQINPHFLHNTLNTIKWMSIMSGNKPITEMLLSLGHLLDMSIHRGQEVIRLKEEMENVRSFTVIQKYRFGDTIQVVEEIDPDTWEAFVPKLSLQPLVENVYHHGLFIEGGEITIRSRKDGELLYLEVVDNGGELTEERRQEIMHQLNTEQDGSFSRIGLKNVHKRIQMIFGGNHGVQLEIDEERKTTCVSIQLPYRRDWDDTPRGD